MPLILVKRPGSPNWYLRDTVRGLQVLESTKTSDDEAAETIRILRERELLNESIFGKKITVTFAEAASAYVAAGGSTRFLTRLTESLSSRLLREIKQHELDALARKLYPSSAPETRNRQCYTPFIAIWNYAVDNEWADVRKWKRPRKNKGTSTVKSRPRAGDRPVDYDRAALFVANMSPSPAMVMTTLFYTGMRPIEVFLLEATDVDVEKRWIVVRHSKTGEPRGVPIHEFLVPLFRALLKRKSRYRQIFQSYRSLPYALHDDRGGQLSNGIIGARKRLAAQGVQIADVSPYTARHTVSTQLVINGIHPHIKDQILGHAVTDMSRRYTTVPQAPLIEAINSLPVPAAWHAMDWWKDPLTATRMHVKWVTHAIAQSK